MKIIEEREGILCSLDGAETTVTPYWKTKLVYVEHLTTTLNKLHPRIKDGSPNSNINTEENVIIVSYIKRSK